MKAGQAGLERMADEFSLDIIYVFESQAKAVVEWLRGGEKGLSASSASNVNIGIKPSRAKRLSVKEKVSPTIAFEDLLSAGRVNLVVLPEADPFLNEPVKDFEEKGKFVFSMIRFSYFGNATSGFTFPRPSRVSWPVQGRSL
jgi:hypothetical protein